MTPIPSRTEHYRTMRFNRMEIAGSLGDLGTLLPLTMGMILVNDLSAVGTFFAIGLFYLLAGYYFKIPVAVQPMKVIAAYAIATGMTAQQVSSSTLLICIFMAIIGLTGAITHIGRLIPKSVVRGVQLATGVLLMNQGIHFILGTSASQQATGLAEPFFRLQHIGPVPVGFLLGIGGFFITLALLNSKRFPAAIILISLGLLAGFCFGDYENLIKILPGIYLPQILPYGFPSSIDLSFALFALVLPQIPMTLGNAVVATTELSKEYFPGAAERVSYRSMTLSMAFASGLCFLLGGIPLCHGAGGLAAHYRFGARTHGSNIVIGTLFIMMAIFLGPHAIALLHLLPMAILGVLLLFAGVQLGMSIIDIEERADLFVLLIMLGLTLVLNLAWAFVAGVLLAHALRSGKLHI
ncbi:putative sulfate/molybdate transporter [Desulfosediminicola ganghwensis]|uniref:putative sulfate/molybdate transporter n=1 Tax=Desulfosediminicola ganghwensis TaxID=2569540 RepID=UPI001E2FF9C1|nr:putative sulfate/molybdate transporter [Desulfosediminicola ganghwensis]